MAEHHEVKSFSRFGKEYFKLDRAAPIWWDPGLPWYRAQLDTITDVVDVRNKHILDVGTGDGRFAIHCAKGGARRIEAVDICGKMLSIAQENAKNNGIAKTIRFVQADAESLEFYRSDVFDVVIAMEIFMLLPNPRKTVEGLRRVAKKSGIIVANTDIPFTRSWYHRILHNRTIYYSLPLRVRKMLNKYLGLPDLPRCENGNRELDQLKTTEETVSAIRENPATRLLRSEDVVNKISKGDFIEMFRCASLEVFKVVRVGYWFCPNGYTIFARKI